MIKKGKKILIAILAASMLATTGLTVFAASNDGWTEASKTEAAQNGAWESWCTQWESIKNNPIQMSLTPGSDATKLNFGWYSKDTEANPRLKISKNKDMSDAKELEVTSKAATSGYISNKAIASDLEQNTTYFYSYQINGQWTEPAEYKPKSSDDFSFIFVGDPQIGSSCDNVATGDTQAQGQDKAVRNDSFIWNNTINSALKVSPNASFLLSAGDQIQSRDKKQPNAAYNKNEIEYGGFLSPSALKSLPVATAIGNHDAPSGNYSYHFNNPNATSYGMTMAGGDYYYSYGDALFIMLNTNNENIDEHDACISEAIKNNPNVKWRVVTVHQDIYGSGEHSNEPDVVNLRYKLIPIFEKNNIDVVFSGHDHCYSRSQILKGGTLDQSTMISEDEFDNYFEQDLAGNTQALDSKYYNYLSSIEDKNTIANVSSENGAVVNPKGILYITGGSASGSKYYSLVSKQQAYIATRWQQDVPTYSIINVDQDSFTINTYRTDNNEIIDNYSIKKQIQKENTTETKIPSMVNAVPSVNQNNTQVATNTVSSGTKTGDGTNLYTVIILGVISVAMLGNSIRLNRKYN